MYHYVRNGSVDLPYFRYLAFDDFRRQLDYFEKEYGFVSRETFLQALDTGALPTSEKALESSQSSGVVLTFDDGFADHYDFCFPELKARGLWGVFFVPAGIYTRSKALDVHRIHMLLAEHGGAVMLEAMRDLVEERMLSHEHVGAFRTMTYTRQDNDDATNLFKRTFNYYISYEWREHVLDTLVARFSDDAAMQRQLYMNLEQLREMQRAGMLIGSHGFNHLLFSKLPVAEQEREIVDSFEFLESQLGDLQPRSFCYPYGGFHSFTDDTRRILAENGCLFSFNVEGRDIEAADVRDTPQALPRYDCNLIPYGKASMGVSPSPCDKQSAS